MEHARTAENSSNEQSQRQSAHWMTINGRHVLIDEPQGRSLEMKQPRNEQERYLTIVVLNETGGLCPSAEKGHGSAKDLHRARIAVAEISKRLREKGHPEQVAPGEGGIYTGLWYGLATGDKDSIKAWNDSVSAAQERYPDQISRAMQVISGLMPRAAPCHRGHRGERHPSRSGHFGTRAAATRRQRPTCTFIASRRPRLYMNLRILVSLLGALLIFPKSAHPTAVSHEITENEGRALLLAIEDEIYERGFQKHFYMVGPEMSPGVTRLPLYVQPTVKNDGGTAIYKLMPYGEVLRGFHFKPDGVAVLESDPESGFPSTGPDMLTLYLDDDDVCRWKHSWKKYHFEVVDSPSAEMIEQAAARQKQRLGYSYREMPPREHRSSPPSHPN